MKKVGIRYILLIVHFADISVCKNNCKNSKLKLPTEYARKE